MNIQNVVTFPEASKVTLSFTADIFDGETKIAKAYCDGLTADIKYLDVEDWSLLEKLADHAVKVNTKIIVPHRAFQRDCFVARLVHESIARPYRLPGIQQEVVKELPNFGQPQTVEVAFDILNL